MPGLGGFKGQIGLPGKVGVAGPPGLQGPQGEPGVQVRDFWWVLVVRGGSKETESPAGLVLFCFVECNPFLKANQIYVREIKLEYVFQQMMKGSHLSNANTSRFS